MFSKTIVFFAVIFSALSSQAVTCQVLDSLVYSTSDATYTWEDFELPADEALYSKVKTMESCSFNVTLANGRYSLGIVDSGTRDGNNMYVKDWAGVIQFSYSRQSASRVCMMKCEK